MIKSKISCCSIEISYELLEVVLGVLFQVSCNWLFKVRCCLLPRPSRSCSTFLLSSIIWFCWMPAEFFWLWLQSYSSSAKCFNVLLSPLFTVDFILQLVFCHSYLISSSVPNKEFNLFSLSQRLRRELITVYRHFNSLTVHSDSILTLQRYTGPSTSKYTLEKLKLE